MKKRFIIPNIFSKLLKKENNIEKKESLDNITQNDKITMYDHTDAVNNTSEMTADKENNVSEVFLPETQYQNVPAEAGTEKENIKSIEKDMDENSAEQQNCMKDIQSKKNQAKDEKEENIKKQKKERKPWSTRKRIIVFSCLGIIAAFIIGVGVYALSIIINPMSPFENAAQQAAAMPEQTSAVTSMASQNTPPDEEAAEDDGIDDGTEVSDLIPSADPYNELLSKSDLSILDKIVNIMLIGVDYAQERETWSGKHAYHADVMIVLSINTEKNEIHLISLPRDTYAKIPGVKGIYKLNASIDCGGGWPTEGGFNKVCEAASWMLGGIPIKYYYAVDMAAVKGLVDTIDGVDYNVDLDFTMQGRSYQQGMQHMSGQAVLDYFRVRKHIDSEEAGDLNRINRQKELLIAIFKKLKDTDMLLKLPDILGSFKGSLYTNTTLAQTGGLAAFAYKLGNEKIFMHSMDGKYANGIFNWNFVITDQNKRVQLIKEVYGIDVEPYSQYDYGSAMSLWRSMQNKIIVSRAKSVLAKVKKKLDADAKLPEKPVETDKPSETPAKTPEATPAPSETPSQAPSETTPAVTAFKPVMAMNVAAKVASGYRKYGSDEWAFYYKVRGELKSPGEKLKADIEKLCSMFSISKPNWRVNYEKGSNQIYVDFN